MGYSELLCQICGVSSNIGRIRTKDESSDSSWDGRGDGFIETGEWPCKKGCWVVSADGASIPYDFSTDGFGQGNHLLEHMAGPDCANRSGYNGNHIAVKEMLGSWTLQALCTKQQDWSPAQDDQDFERDPKSKFFLSGLLDHPPGADMGDSKVTPCRHGLDEPRMTNLVSPSATAKELFMPFHPYCLEVYKRAAMAKFGKFDPNILMDWYHLDSTFANFYVRFPRATEARLGNEQRWSHNHGHHWIAANPCFIPTLNALLATSCTKSETADPDVVFASFASDTYDDQADVFERLCPAIRLRILLYLKPADIACLRLSTRSFRQLPQLYFRDLIRNSMPWVWEVWCAIPYCGWTTVTEEAMKRNQTQQAPAPEDAQVLPKNGVDWFRLYTTIKRDWQNVNGLRNRERIWNDCNYILDRIEGYQTRGWIDTPPGCPAVNQNTSDGSSSRQSVNRNADVAGDANGGWTPRPQASHEKLLSPPKLPLSSYAFFSLANRERLQLENPNETLGSIGKLLGHAWLVASEQERVIYDNMAQDDRERYKAEKIRYNEQREW